MNYYPYYEFEDDNQVTYVRNTREEPYQGSHEQGGGAPGAGGHMTTRAKLEIQGEIRDMSRNWSNEEWTKRRRLVQFKRIQQDSVIKVEFMPLAFEDYEPGMACVSCIYWDQKGECVITSVDAIYLLEQLVNCKFTIEEKNRIRRNLEGYHPLTVSKQKPSSEDFFKLIMGFPQPKPRNIEKDVNSPGRRWAWHCERSSPSTRPPLVPPHIITTPFRRPRSKASISSRCRHSSSMLSNPSRHRFRPSRASSLAKAQPTFVIHSPRRPICLSTASTNSQAARDHRPTCHLSCHDKCLTTCSPDNRLCKHNCPFHNHRRRRRRLLTLTGSTPTTEPAVVLFLALLLLGLLPLAPPLLFHLPLPRFQAPPLLLALLRVPPSNNRSPTRPLME